jgi:hypothetical protein
MKSWASEASAASARRALKTRPSRRASARCGFAFAAERVLVDEQRLHPLGRLEGGKRPVELAAGHRLEPDRVVDEQLRVVTCRG